MNNRKDFQKLQDVKAPSEWKERTLAAARALRQEGEAGGSQKRPAPRHRFSWVRRSLAAACALAVVLGGVKLLPPEGTDTRSPVDALAHSFGLVAYAAETREMIEPQGSRIVFDSGAGSDDPENGFFSGCLFRITGDNIKSVSASIDKGGLYRANTIPIEEKDITAMLGRTDSRTEGASQVMVYGDGPSEEVDTWYADLCFKLENGFTEAYDPDISYGLWAPAKTGQDPSDDMQAAWHGQIDQFDGATMTVTVTFTDDTTQTQTLHLKTGKLAVSYEEGRQGPRLTGEVTTDPSAPYIYGVYGEIG